MRDTWLWDENSECKLSWRFANFGMAMYNWSAS